ncbi:MAG: MoxR family ATPase [Chloroflexota bacterium]
MTESNDNKNWYIFHGERPLDQLPGPPPWRDFKAKEPKKRKTGDEYRIQDDLVELVNTAIYLRRPLLITGPPGTGKSSLATEIARYLDLGEVIEWAINSRSTVQDALYRYDPLARLQAAQDGENRDSPEDIGQFLRLGPLGTAFALSKNETDNNSQLTVLLIDEIDKSDIDLPNDLLHIFEDGFFEITEIARLKQENNVKVEGHKQRGPVT